MRSRRVGVNNDLQERANLDRFERTVMPHLRAAYSLARSLCRNDQAAEDIVQEACVRAYRSLDGCRGGDARPWLMAIVRNATYTWLQKNRGSAEMVPFDEELHGVGGEWTNPETLVWNRMEQEEIARAIDELPVEYREVVVLREVEDLSYREIAETVGIPIGTVMSRLARARRRLAERLANAPAECPDTERRRDV